jgi:chromosomal replication initiator protein
VNNLVESDTDMMTSSSPEKIWSGARDMLRTLLNPDIFNLWFAPLRAATVNGESITLEVANDFCELWLKDNYGGLIQDAVTHSAGKPLKVIFRVSAQGAAMKKPEQGAPVIEEVEEPVEKAGKELKEIVHFNPKNTFENFVVGTNNHFAHAAAMAVAQAPGKSYNPLFVYGGVGLGKTHLLHAIGQYVVRHNRHAKVAYVSSEKFTNEYIDGIQNNQLVRFRKKYRQTDVLLIDDIQFLSGKERIQEEFFHTFNALHENHKQIVMTCDRPATEIQNLEHRLDSRVEWGLVTD